MCVTYGNNSNSHNNNTYYYHYQDETMSMSSYGCHREPWEPYSFRFTACSVCLFLSSRFMLILLGVFCVLARFSF